MIRPFTFLCMLLAGGAGLYLYQVKHRTRVLEVEIDHTLDLTQAVRARTGVLRADYAFLNEPGRLQGLADANLAMKSISVGQFVQMAELDRRLPAVVIPQAAPTGSSDEPDAADVVAGDVPPLPPIPPAVAAPPVVAARPIPAPAIVQAAATTAPSLHKPPRPPAPPLLAVASPEHEAIQPAVVRRPAPPSLPAPIPVAAARLRYTPYASTPYATAAAAAGSFVNRPVAAVGSALGNFRAALPPPVPVSVSPFDELSSRR